jgi:hypothetical protein
MAHSFIFIVVASVLATFRIEKAVRDGRVVEPTGAFTPGILACVTLHSFIHGNGSVPDGASDHFFRSPEKFECEIKPRSKEAEALVRATATT